MNREKNICVPSRKKNENENIIKFLVLIVTRHNKEDNTSVKNTHIINLTTIINYSKYFNAKINLIL